MGRRLRLLTEDVEELKNELARLEIGDRFTLGNYHGPIEWRILNKNSNSLLVISEYGLDAKPFDRHIYTADWNKCSLKQWLNSDFYNKAFNSEEKSLIEKTPYGKVFCLSKEEVREYFSSKSDRRCKPTQYTLSQRAYMYQGSCCWWLRSIGYFILSAAFVEADGGINSLNGDNVDDAHISVRPAMRLKI